MRTHFDIIKDAGGPHAVGRRLAELLDEDTDKMLSRVRGWSFQSSVPGEYWGAFEREGWATGAELIEAAEAKKLPALAHRAGADGDQDAAA